MTTSFNAQLLDAARHHSEAAKLAEYIERTLFEIFSAQLPNVQIDRDEFTARALRAFMRGSIEGVTLDVITLTAIIESAARLDLNSRQRQILREDVARINHGLLELLRELKGAER
jgi:hypothetical protein